MSHQLWPDLAVLRIIAEEAAVRIVEILDLLDQFLYSGQVPLNGRVLNWHEVLLLVI